MSKKIMLKSSDGESFEVDEAVALQSQTIVHLIEDDCASDGVPLANVKSNILAKVIEYCKKHVDGGDSSSGETKAKLKKWDAEFMKTDSSTILSIMIAANYLNINSLIELTCQTVADEMLSGKTPDEIRATFSIENDYTPEEEAANRKENPWAYE